MAKTGSGRSRAGAQKASKGSKKDVAGNRRRPRKSAKQARQRGPGNKRAAKVTPIVEVPIQAGGGAPGTSQGEKKASPKKQVKEAREAVFKNLPEIVQGLAKKSGDNYLAAKFLFDFARVAEVSKAAKQMGKRSSVAGLLKTLGFADDKGEAAKRSKMKGSEASKSEQT